MAKRTDNTQAETAKVTAQVRQWLRTYGKSFYSKDLEVWLDCDAIDSCIYDLSLQDHRSLVGSLVDQYINAQ